MDQRCKDEELERRQAEARRQARLDVERQREEMNQRRKDEEAERRHASFSTTGTPF